MATSITLKDELYKHVVERARTANTTPDEWLDRIVAERLESEDLAETTRAVTKEIRRKVAALGVKPSDVEREIADYRHSR